MMNCIIREQIDPYNLYGDVLGYNHDEKTQICRFAIAFQLMLKLLPDAQTFEINGHEASV